MILACRWSFCDNLHINSQAVIFLILNYRSRQHIHVGQNAHAVKPNDEALSRLNAISRNMLQEMLVKGEIQEDELNTPPGSDTGE